MHFRKVFLGGLVVALAGLMSSVNAQSAAPSSGSAPRPDVAKALTNQPLNLTPVTGAGNVYTDSFGNRFTVTPEDGGSLCDPNGCMVKVCNSSGGACTWYYCTVLKCTKVSTGQGASIEIRKGRPEASDTAIG